ncbi:hypothetical protein PISMIDRAFT_675056 [Pisolithus microcarpus 441]|uniref:Uncharacterized protein n=1 Tax=Pisolithus microcarpus 441 TaxID=765257 RepID=A0A0D0A570_9AGAM|nr:hypothetical protein PISMIDRAFT_675056 [Pisolithus microcarpus 441]
MAYLDASWDVHSQASPLQFFAHLSSRYANPQSFVISREITRSPCSHPSFRIVMTAILRFGIALYSPLRHGEGHHWALVVSQPGQNSLQGRVNVYQIVHSPHDGYQTSHKIVDESNGAVLQQSGRYYGVVDLGPLHRVTTDYVFATIGTSLPSRGRTGYHQGNDGLVPGGSSDRCVC